MYSVKYQQLKLLKSVPVILYVHLKSINCLFVSRSMSPFCVFVTCWLSSLLILTYLSTVWAMILASVCCKHYFYTTAFIVWTRPILDSLVPFLSHFVLSLFSSINFSFCLWPFKTPDNSGPTHYLLPLCCSSCVTS